MIAPQRGAIFVFRFSVTIDAVHAVNQELGDRGGADLFVPFLFFVSFVSKYQAATTPTTQMTPKRSRSAVSSHARSHRAVGRQVAGDR
jgi:hypothetical protein